MEKYLKKILFLIPFFYKWNTYSNVRANYEYLQFMGYKVDIINNKERNELDFSKYDFIILSGSGAFLTDKEYKRCNIPIISMAWSDPNLFNERHFNQGNIYCTNDLKLSKSLKGKPIYFYNTACDKRYHRNLNLEKEIDILIYASGNHKFILNRNEVVNKLRDNEFKIDVYGKGWDSHPDTHHFITGKELIKKINQAHLTLDLSNNTTAWAHRIFESSACSTPCLTYDRIDTRQLFKIGHEILIYKTFEDIVEVLNMVLSVPDDLKEIGLDAQKRCYKDHDISIRIQELLKIIKENNL